MTFHHSTSRPSIPAFSETEQTTFVIDPTPSIKRRHILVITLGLCIVFAMFSIAIYQAIQTTIARSTQEKTKTDFLNSSP
ncbi:hypothetical protein [Pajaroellobacter abortibovis]|uniref:Uncharacterized protein n=1 Tax=Pajaroellobacter abortibovis TaxID=1882918 RepID=A0A1L6MUY1_9BACT|nr:hypothetical protein [Pajaroellobacter abortibovis]APR99296.1 hypothetical protein BCY86_00355 [Pajaroellobacter abortibovis]